MADRDSVIEGLDEISRYDGDQMFYNDVFIREIAEDALVLLKEQDAVEPRVSSVEQRCGNCNKVIEMDGWKACPWCGKPILWEAVGRSVKRE